MPEMERVFAELTALAEMVNGGEAGLPAIQRLVELAQGALDAVGASFAEYGPVGGRVIAASGSSRWAVGRQVDPADALGPGGAPIVEARVEEVPTELAGQLAGRGIRRLLGARVEVTGHVVGAVHAYFPDDGAANPYQRSAISLFAGVAGHLYGDSRGLPVYADTPVIGTLADAIAVVGPDGAVRSWN